MAKHRPATRARRFLLPILMIGTLVLFLAPSAQATTTVTVTKTAVPAEGTTVEPGSTISYSIAIVNSGSENATNVQLTDATPANTTYVAGSAQANGTPIAGGNPFTNYAFGDLGPGTTTATFDVTVNAVADTTPITNSASITAGNTAGGSLSDVANHTVQSQPHLTVDKTSVPPEGGPVTPGDTVTYTIDVENDVAATATATAVKLDDPTPANTTYVDDSAQVDGGAPIAGGNPFTNYSLGDMDPGESHIVTFDVLVDGPPLANGTAIDNTATVDATNSAISPSDDANLTVASVPGLTINKTSSPAEGGTVIPGATVTYTIAVTNAALATATATGVSVTDATPTNTTYVAGSTKLDGVAVADNASAPLNPLQDGQALPDMVPGSTHSFTFNVLVDKPLDNAIPIANTATLSHDQGANTSNGATLTVQSAPALTIAKTSAPAEGGAVTPGTTIAYSIVVTNAASATEKAKQLKLVDPTPAYTTYVEGTAKVDGTALAGNGNPFNVPLTLSDLLPGASHTIVFSVKVDSPLAKGTVISNLAKVTGQNHADVQDGATHTVDSAPVMRVFLSALPKPGVKLEENDLITYTIVVQNDVAATESLRNVLVRDPVPDGTEFYEGSAKVDGVTVARPVEQAADTRLLAPGPFPGGYELGTMAPGTSHTLTYRVRVKEAADTITNRVFVTADNASQVVVTATHRGPASGGAGGNGNGGNGNGGSGGTGTGGTGTSSGDDSLAFTGLDLARLLLLAMTLLLAGWTLVARGRAVQRRGADNVTNETPPSTGSAIVDRWVDAWFYPRARR
jgi:uncharacterized repeat protein (TIGR01451 family)